MNSSNNPVNMSLGLSSFYIPWKKERFVIKRHLLCGQHGSRIWLISSLTASPLPRASQIDAKLNILMVKKGNVIPQCLSEFTMHRHIFSTKWGQNSNFSPSLWHTVLIRVANCDVRTVGIFPLTYVNSKLAFSLFPQFIGGTNFHLWIVRSGENFDWIFCGGHSFHFVHFPIIEKNGIVKLAAGKYRNLQQKGEKVIVVRYFFLGIIEYLFRHHHGFATNGLNTE